MRKFLSRLTAMLMAVIAWVSAAPDANAWTAEELCTKFDFGIEQWDGSANQNCWIVNGRKVDINWGYLPNGTEVFIVKNFLGAFDMYFTVSGNTVTGYNITNRNWYPTSGVGTSVKIGNYTVYSITIDRIVRADFIEHKYGSYFLGYEITYDTPVAPYYDHWGYLTTSTLNVAQSQLYYKDDPVYYHSTEWEGTITNDEYGNTVIDFGPYNSHLDNQAIKVSYCNRSGNIIDSNRSYDMFDSYRLTLCKTNGMASDDTNATLNNVSSYPVSVLMPGSKGLKNNEFGILNFFNVGMGWENFMNDEGYVWGEYDILKGYVDGDKFVIPQQMFRSQVSGSYTNGEDPTYTNYYTFGYDPVTHERKSDITGTIQQGLPTHYCSNYWVHTVNGGTLHTYLGGNIKLDPWGNTDKSTDTNPPHWTSYDASVKNTVITYFDFNQEITFDCDLQVTLGDTYGDNGKDYVKAEFALTEKDDFCSDYTTHYDVYYLEGEYTHAANVPVAQAKKIQTVVFDDNKTTYTFSYDLPYPEGYEPTENPTESQKYTFFVVANYNAALMAEAHQKGATNGSAPSLASTYHALTTVGKPLPTALNGLAVAEAQIKVVSGAVVVEGFDGVVEVYNAQGACVYTGTDSRIELNGGVYIVRAGTKAVKVVIG